MQVEPAGCLAPVSVVVCTTGRLEELRNVLTSLAEQRRRPAEVIIVDQSGVDGVAAVCGSREWPFALKHVRVSWRSLANARNVGVDAADAATRWILFLDDDVVLSPTYIEELLRGAERHSEAKILFGVIENLKPSPSTYNFFAKLVGLPYHGPGAGFRVMPSFKTTMDTRVTTDLPAEWATGCGFMVERNVFVANRFDSNLVSYSLDEDLDFTFRVGKTGKDLLWCIAAARLTHFEAPANRLNADRLALMRTLYDVYFFFKNRRLGLSLWRFILSEAAYTLAIAGATLVGYQGNPYPLGPHLRSYLYVLKFWRELRRGNLIRVNELLTMKI
ncbi:MAG: glycosyltransferase family 2 protein [Firmicutes bacterium]|nr:glycosyltransferase family 2 protein [Bacillota bacterium]